MRPDTDSEPNCHATAVVYVSFLALIAWVSLMGGLDWLFPDAATAAEFIRNLIIAGTAVVLGIPVALSINRRVQQAQNRNRRRQLLSALRRVFYENIEYLKRAAHMMDAHLTQGPSFPLDLVTLDATTDVRYQLLSDGALRERIDRAHFELLHVTRRFEILATMIASQRHRFIAMADDRASLLAHLQLFHETQGLAHAVATHEIPGHGACLWDSELNIVAFKMESLSLMVGLTPREKGTAGTLEGAAVAHCRTAIAAIDEALGSAD